MPKSTIKVAHISTVHPTFDNRIFFKECLSLVKSGYIVYLITPNNKSEIVSGINIIGIKKRTNRFHRMILTTITAIVTAIKIRPDVYHVHDPELLPWAFLLSIFGKNVIFDMHENFAGSMLTKTYLHTNFREAISSIYLCAERFLISRMNIIYAEESYQNFHSHRNNITILNLPKINELLQIEEPKRSLFTIGYIGLVSKGRGSITTLESLKIVKAKGYSVRFECIGSMDHKSKTEINHFLNKTHLENIYYHGFLKSIDGFRIVAQCHVGLAILEPLPNYTHSIPTKLFEYMALGIPVIISDFPFYRSLIKPGYEDCVIFVDPTSANEIAEAILFLFHNRQIADEMGAKGRQFVKKFYNWEKESTKLSGYYNHILFGNAR